MSLLGDLMHQKLAVGAKRDAGPSSKKDKKDKKHKKKSEKKDKKKSSKKEKKESREEKSKPKAPSFNKRAIPFDGDKDYGVLVLYRGSGSAPFKLDAPGHGADDADITRLRLVGRNGLPSISVLALPLEKEKRWEFLSKEAQTKLLQNGALKTNLGKAITRQLIVAWRNRWPIDDANAEATTESLEHFPLVSDSYAAGMPQFLSKGIKLEQLGERVGWSAVRSSATELFPLPSALQAPAPYTSSDELDDISIADDLSISGLEDSDDDAPAEQPEQQQQAEPEKPPCKEPLKPRTGPNTSAFGPLGDGLKSLRVLSANSGEQAAKIIEQTALNTAIGQMDPIVVPGDKRPSETPAKKKSAVPSKRQKVDEAPKASAPVAGTPAPKQQQHQRSAITLEQSHWTARRLLQGYEKLEKSGALESRLDSELIAKLSNSKLPLTWFFSMTGPLREVGLSILLELRWLEIGKPSMAITHQPISAFVAALGMLDEEKNSPEATITAVKELSSGVLSQCSIPETKPATLIQHFKNGVLDNVEELWLHNFLRGSVQFDIGSKSEADIAAYSQALNADKTSQRTMLTLISLWKGRTASPTTDDDELEIF